MSTLQGQTAVITGAGRGIGRAIAQACAAEGARVALVSRSTNQLESAAQDIRDAGGTALCVPADITNPQRVEEMARRVEAEWGSVDLLVNNAGAFRAIGPVWDVAPAEWWSDVTTNLYGPFLCCHALLPGMPARNRGCIINIVGGGTGYPFPYGSAYASSKAAVMRLTESLAAELRKAQAAIVIFAVEPGFVRTAITEYHRDSPAGKKWLSGVKVALAEGRDVSPTRAAALVVALAGGRFDRLSGRYFEIADNLEEVLAQQEEIIAQDHKTLRLQQARPASGKPTI